jgi:uncharacterized membrane protein
VYLDRAVFSNPWFRLTSGGIESLSAIKQDYEMVQLAIESPLGTMDNSARLTMLRRWKLMSIAMTLHILGVIIWVGGMFFAHMVLRPALNHALEAPQRLPLLLRVFDGFFPWVWGAVIAIVASGFWMLFTIYEDNIGYWLGFMSVVGVVMAAIFVFIYAIPYSQIGVALQEDDTPKLVEAVNLIRQLILVNLILGMLVSAVATLGKYGLLQ